MPSELLKRISEPRNKRDHDTTLYNAGIFDRFAGIAPQQADASYFAGYCRELCREIVREAWQAKYTS